MFVVLLRICLIEAAHWLSRPTTRTTFGEEIALLLGHARSPAYEDESTLATPGLSVVRPFVRNPTYVSWGTNMADAQAHAVGHYQADMYDGSIPRIHTPLPSNPSSQLQGPNLSR
ncbi:hypothetical protein FZEAL_8384 [Fusarium zealandicum]|uniref:Uncharacterized protein n=1 Tax=Fusarium zealandicum TaxID=1053134 RepID=A0A8H4XHW9_9HYPO|nr:hypothetical protein FZEAL_8384 [Fusarium zealandicum]